MKPPEFESLSQYHELPRDEMVERSRTYLEDVRRRRTVRDFDSREIPAEVIEACIAAAATAPNGANQQPWHFAIVRNKMIQKQIREAAEEEERAFYEQRAPDDWLNALAPLGTDAEKPFLETAPCLIAIFAQQYSIDDKGQRVKHYYVSESVGIATGILITGLHLSGLASLTHTPSPMKFLNQILNRPSNERPYILLVVGYPAVNAQVPKITKKPREEIVSEH